MAPWLNSIFLLLYSIIGAFQQPFSGEREASFMADFVLDPRFEAETFFICDLKLSQLRLQNQKAVPWLLLLPRRNEIELYRLDAKDRALLMDEIVATSRALEILYKPDKINVATLGNVVSQMHVHVIGRYKNDPVWPRPVWGQLPPLPYGEDEIGTTKAKLQAAFSSQK